MSSLRPPTSADIPVAAALVAQHWPDPVDDDRIEREWTLPRIDLERDVRIGDGVYALVEDMGEDRAWVEAHGAVTADAFEWAEARAAEMGAGRIFSGAWVTNALVLRQLRQRGYAPVRHSYRMEADLGVATQVTPPEGIELRTFQRGDERTFYDVQEEAFRDTWEPVADTYEEWAHWYLQSPRFEPELWFLAHDGSEACGVALCHPHPAVPDLGWIDILAVRRPWRRRGIGRALLFRAFEGFRERGLARAGLGVDAESITGAHALYESVGMRETTRFEIYEKASA